MKKHGITIADYTAVHGRPTPTKMSYHQCHLCQTVILFTRVGLANHLTRHKVSVRDYGNNYLKKIRSENVKNVKIEDIGDVGEPGLVKKTYHESDMTSSAYKKSNMQLDKVDWSVNTNTNTMSVEKGRKVGTQKIPQWCDGTMYKCPFCFTIYYRYFTFRIHLINSHKMKDSEERIICVRENEILTDIYRCKICSAQMKRDRMDIEAHMKQTHRITLRIYSGNFENPSVADTPDESLEKLVREEVLTDFNINKRSKRMKRKFAEPRKSHSQKKKTPPAVPPPENASKLVRVLRSTGSATMKTGVDDLTNNDSDNDSNYNESLATSYTDSDSDSQHMFSQKRKKRSPSPSEKRSKLKISHVRSMANENHQQIKVDKERESSGSGISLLFFLSRSFFFNSVFR